MTTIETGTIRFYEDNALIGVAYGFISPCEGSGGKSVYFVIRNHCKVAVTSEEEISWEYIATERFPIEGDNVVFVKRNADRCPVAVHWCYKEDFDAAQGASNVRS